MFGIEDEVNTLALGILETTNKQTSDFLVGSFNPSEKMIQIGSSPQVRV